MSSLTDQVTEAILVALEKAGYNSKQPRNKHGEWSHLPGWAAANQKAKAAGKGDQAHSKAPTATDGAGRSPGLQKALAAKEKEIAGLDHEKAVVLDKAGKVLIDQDGEQTSVMMEDHFDKLKGNILTHNHPDTGDLSKPDLRLTVDADVGEMRAVVEKLGLTLSLAAPKGGWQGSKGKWDSDLGPKYDQILTDALNQAEKNQGATDMKKEVASWFPDFEPLYVPHIRRVALKRWADSVGAKYTEMKMGD